jgi:hypothetical protein
MACHNGAFQPTLDNVDLLRANLLDGEMPNKRLSCKQDPLVNKADWSKSFMIRKSDPALNGDDVLHAVTCLDGSPNGKARMPFQMPPLTADEFDCMRWYIYQLATNGM